MMQIVAQLLAQNETDARVINKAGETALDTAEKMCQQKILETLQEHGAKRAKVIKPQAQSNNSRELKQTVSDIKQEVHHQLEHTRQTRRRVQGIVKQVNKMHTEGLNNAINSTTVVASLIASVAFGAIFTVPGQFQSDPTSIPPGSSFGEAVLAPNPVFLIFFVFDSFALFISLAVVVVQTSVVVIESKAKKLMMAIINKLMWLACVLITVSFLAMSYIIVGLHGRWMAIAVTIIGTTIMAATLGTMCYWVIQHRMEAKTRKSRLRKASVQSKSTRSWSVSDSELLNAENFKKMYAI